MHNNNVIEFILMSSNAHIMLIQYCTHTYTHAHIHTYTHTVQYGCNHIHILIFNTYCTHAHIYT